MAIQRTVSPAGFQPQALSTALNIQQQQPRKPALKFGGVGDQFQKGFIPVMPQVAMGWSYDKTMSLLEQRIGKDQLIKALNPNETIPGPNAGKPDGKWLQSSKMIAVNPRSLDTYLGIIKYALTFPEDAIHIMPLFEPGYGGSLYAPISWKLNPEFMDQEWARKTGLDTLEKQLKAMVNILHALGKNVGIDITPHTDRFSETAMAFPEYFDWMKIEPESGKILQNDDTTYKGVQKVIQEKFLTEFGDARTLDPSLNTMDHTDSEHLKGAPLDEDTVKNLFSESSNETHRMEVLFGPDKYPHLQNKRRVVLMNILRDHTEIVEGKETRAGFETLPVTGSNPYRPVHVKEMSPGGDGKFYPVFSAEGNAYHDVWGSITPFKWTHTTADNVPDFSRPNVKARHYFTERVKQVQQAFGFDFLRADMAHIQMRKGGLPKTPDNPHDLGIWAYTKQHIQKDTPHFATLAEGFPYDDRYGMGDNFKDMDAQQFDVVLNSLHYVPVNNEYVEKLKEYDLETVKRTVGYELMAGMITADSCGVNMMYPSSLSNLVRMFTGLFTRQPSYQDMGFETRDEAMSTNPRYYNRNFILADTKNVNGENGMTNIEVINRYLKKFKLDQPWLRKLLKVDAKENHGPFLWGSNTTFNKQVGELRKAYTEVASSIRNNRMAWLETKTPGVGAWVFFDPNNKRPDLLCVVNSNLGKGRNDVTLTLPEETDVKTVFESAPSFKLEQHYTTAKSDLLESISHPKTFFRKQKAPAANVIRQGEPIRLTHLAPGEGRVYRIKPNPA